MDQNEISETLIHYNELKSQMSTKGRPPVTERSFFYKVYKGGGGVISVYKNLCCKFSMFRKPFGDMEFA